MNCSEEEMKNCPDCGVEPGETHLLNCDVERCPVCGHQRLCCGCDIEGFEPLPWTGRWPGEAEAEEYGFYCYWKPEGGWGRCVKEHPEARPDLNRLVTECKWDAQLRKFVKEEV